MNDDKFEITMKVENMMQDLYGKDVMYNLDWNFDMRSAPITLGNRPSKLLKIEVLNQTSSIGDLNDIIITNDDAMLTQEEIDKLVEYFQDFKMEIDFSLDEMEKEHGITQQEETPEEKARKQKEAFKRAMGVAGI